MKRVLFSLMILVLFAAPALADGQHDKPPKTTTTLIVEETTTTEATTTTSTTVPLIEVCRDGQIVTIRVDELADSDDRIWDDFDRRDCQPPPVPTTPSTLCCVYVEWPIEPVLPWTTTTAATTTEPLITLPFTGTRDGLLLAGLAALVLGGLMVRSGRANG